MQSPEPGLVQVHRPPYKVMHVILNQCLRQSFGKALFAVFLYSVVQSLAASAALVPLMQGGGFGAGAVLLAPVLLVAVLFACCMLSYGLAVICARLVEKKYVTLGYLFVGFRVRDRRLPAAAAVFVAAALVLLSLFSVLLVVAAARVQGAVQALGQEQALRLAAGIGAPVAGALLVALFSPCAFVWLLLYTEQGLSARGAFRQGFVMMRGQFWHFAGFVLYAGGGSLVAAAVLTVLLALAPSPQSASPLSVLVLVLSFARFMEYYKAVVRMLLAVPVYYFFTRGILRVHPSEYVPPEQVPAEQAELPSGGAGDGAGGTGGGAEGGGGSRGGE